jgi:sphingosine kinase
VATASGDGIVYEILNGLAARPDARAALHMPIAPIPTGSACSLCINLFGVADTFNIELACLNVIKGNPMSVDLISTLLLPSRERRVGFLSVALGLMVDLDIGTEHLRWMGDNRFVYGFVRGALANKNFKCRLRLKVVDSDKIEMARKAREAVREHKPTMGKGSLPDRLVMGVEAAAETETPSPATAPAAPAPLAAAAELVPDETWLTIESGTPNAGVSPQPHTENGIPAPYGGWAVQGDGVLYA